MQSGRDTVLYKNSFDWIVKIYKNEGHLAFFKGQLANIFRGLGSSLLLVLFDKLH